MIDYPLFQQTESAEYIEMLFQLTKFKGDMKNALICHYVKGFALSNAAHVHEVKLSNLQAACKRMNEVNDIVHKLHLVKQTHNK